MIRFPRVGGLLLHPTSLPGSSGIGDLGQAAYQFIDFLATSGLHLWQVMPLGPTGYGDSPYATLSAFAGNPLLLSLEKLVEDGLLTRADLDWLPAFNPRMVEYGSVIEHKMRLLRHSFERFAGGASSHWHEALAAFCEHHSVWLADYALFMALKDLHRGAVWNTWDSELATRRPDALARARTALAWDVHFYEYVQFLFFRQWSALHTYAGQRGIRIIGDIPIFVAYDSADVWAHPELFFLDEQGNPTVVAGVPPDYFSATGQLWGNPLYRWDRLAETGYAWWIERFRAALAQLDIVRLDHFRGFADYWEVPAGEETAIHGRWVPGPGAAFFHAITAALGEIPIIAEDLGLITPDVHALRDELGYPGMRVLQFAFGTDATNEHLPHQYPHNCVVYTGTHDNDTTVGWYATLPTKERRFLARYLGHESQEIHWDLIRLALASVADMAIIPLQDVMGLGSEARMNLPGRASGNWSWRYTSDQLTWTMVERLRDLVEIYGRNKAASDQL
jgi:4-alpha-glucanotransferase